MDEAGVDAAVVGGLGAELEDGDDPLPAERGRLEVRPVRVPDEVVLGPADLGSRLGALCK